MYCMVSSGMDMADLTIHLLGDGKPFHLVREKHALCRAAFMNRWFEDEQVLVIGHELSKRSAEFLNPSRH